MIRAPIFLRTKLYIVYKKLNKFTVYYGAKWKNEKNEIPQNQQKTWRKYKEIIKNKQTVKTF